MLSPGAIKGWKTLKLGTGLRTEIDWRVALVDSGYHIREEVKVFLGYDIFVASIAPNEIETVLCVATAAQLTGRLNGGTTEEMFAGIKQCGGERCPAEVGPQLRLQYPSQPPDEILFIAMDPMSCHFSPYRSGFCLGRTMDNWVRWLGTYICHPDTFWPGFTKWVFKLP